MDNFGPILILIGNCCLMPAICFFLGYAWALGWIRSPLKIDRRPRYADDQFSEEL